MGDHTSKPIRAGNDCITRADREGRTIQLRIFGDAFSAVASLGPDAAIELRNQLDELIHQIQGGGE
jgi:hypothetical protein